jgi:hypothetical protein
VAVVSVPGGWDGRPKRGGRQALFGDCGRRARTYFCDAETEYGRGEWSWALNLYVRA